MVDNPSLKSVIVILIKDVISILSDEEILHMHYLSELFNEVIVDVLRFCSWQTQSNTIRSHATFFQDKGE